MFLLHGCFIFADSLKQKKWLRCSENLFKQHYNETFITFFLYSLTWLTLRNANYYQPIVTELSMDGYVLIGITLSRAFFWPVVYYLLIEKGAIKLKDLIGAAAWRIALYLKTQSAKWVKVINWYFHYTFCLLTSCVVLFSLFLYTDTEDRILITSLESKMFDKNKSCWKFFTSTGFGLTSILKAHLISL